MLKSSLFTIDDPFLYIAWWSFLSGMIIATLVSLITAPEPLDKIRGLVYGMVLHDNELQDKLQDKLDKD
jgi:hypothetical protein